MVKPGKPLKIIYDVDLIREEISVRDSFVYASQEEKLIVAQTEPRFTEEDLSRNVVITYIDRIDEKPVRLGFEGTILEIFNGFKLENGMTTDAILIKPLGTPCPYNLRRYVRIQVPSSVNVRFYIKDENVSLVDLSVGGACFTYSGALHFSEGDMVRSTLMTNSGSFYFDSKIIRLDKPDPERPSLYWVSSEFVNTPPHIKRALTTIIFEMEKILKWIREGEGG